MKVLESSIEIPIRFSETDAMGVVWHGNYLKFFEDGREYFGIEHGMEYLDVYNQGFYTPIVKTDINYKASVYYGQKIKIRAILESHPASKIVFKYEVINLTTGEIAATGSTTQVFLGVENRILELVKPPFYAEWEKKQSWKTI
ncbi:MAG: acyl-CoA thioesterase [Crocinitomicaceae bacterium]|nr:acyl-CoA thioesterase [Crocinitomicaceae bacterium]